MNQTIDGITFDPKILTLRNIADGVEVTIVDDNRELIDSFEVSSMELAISIALDTISTQIFLGGIEGSIPVETANILDNTFFFDGDIELEEEIDDEILKEA